MVELQQFPYCWTTHWTSSWDASDLRFLVISVYCMQPKEWRVDWTALMTLNNWLKSVQTWSGSKRYFDMVFFADAFLIYMSLAINIWCQLNIIFSRHRPYTIISQIIHDITRAYKIISLFYIDLYSHFSGGWCSLWEVTLHQTTMKPLV